MGQLKLVSPDEPLPDAAAPVAPDPMIALEAEHARIGAELARFIAVSTRRAAAETALAAIEGEALALDATEAAAWRAWASDLSGQQPTSDRAARRALAERRLDAQDELDSARGAEAACQPRQLALLAELHAIEGKMRSIRLAGIRQSALALYADALRLARESGEPLMSIAGLREALVQQAGAARNRHDEGAEKDFLAEVGALDALKAPIVLGDRTVVAKHATEWRRALT